MTQGEANRRLAESLEAKPTFVKTNTGGDERILSVLGFWTCPERCIGLYGESDACGKEWPVDFIHDEGASARLLEAMPNPRLIHMEHRFDVRHWNCVPDYVADPYAYCNHKNRKTAIFLAALRWKGISEEIEAA